MMLRWPSDFTFHNFLPIKGLLITGIGVHSIVTKEQSTFSLPVGPTRFQLLMLVVAVGGVHVRPTMCMKCTG